MDALRPLTEGTRADEAVGEDDGVAVDWAERVIERDKKSDGEDGGTMLSDALIVVVTVIARVMVGVGGAASFSDSPQRCGASHLDPLAA